MPFSIQFKQGTIETIWLRKSKKFTSTLCFAQFYHYVCDQLSFNVSSLPQSNTFWGFCPHGEHPELRLSGTMLLDKAPQLGTLGTADVDSRCTNYSPGFPRFRVWPQQSVSFHGKA